MNGAESLVHTLLACGVTTCIANPGTSEMHFVAALDRIPGMRCVLALQENVVTGAADGFWRMARVPAATLLHCGPGLANGLANLHNARRARSGIVNIVGDHATFHRPLDAPLTADTEGWARGVGWEFLHVCVDDASRLAYTDILPDERKESAVAFLERALAWFAGLGIAVERVMTDNGSAYVSRAFREACETARVTHKRTRPYTPRTKGKAERFIQTSLREWAYLHAFNSSAERAGAMRPWLHAYNRHRPHAALGGKPPFTRLPKDNLLGNDS